MSTDTTDETTQDNAAPTEGEWRLARIDHWRCSEPAADTYVWVPAIWGETEFKQAVNGAKDDYLAFTEEWKAHEQTAPGEPVHSRPDYARWPDKTVAEVDEIWEGLKAERRAWDETRQKARRTFGDYLKARGCALLFEHNPGFRARIDWGHRHGTTIEYDGLDARRSDLAGPDDSDPDDWY